MKSGQKEAVPLVSPTSYAVILTPEIKSKIQIRNATRRAGQRNPHMRSIINVAVNAQAKCIHDDIKELENMNFNHKLSTIGNDKSRMSLWKMTKFLKKRQHNATVPSKRYNITHT